MVGTSGYPLSAEWAKDGRMMDAPGQVEGLPGLTRKLPTVRGHWTARVRIRTHLRDKRWRINRGADEMIIAAKAAGLPPHVTEYAVRLLHQFRESHQICANPELRALLFIAARRSGMPVRLRDFAKATFCRGMGETAAWAMLGRRVRLISRVLRLSIPLLTVEAVQRQAKELLGLSVEFDQRVTELLSSVRGDEPHTLGDPVGWVAGAVWLIGKTQGPVISQDRIAAALGTTQPTIRSRAKQLKSYRSSEGTPSPS